MESSIKAVDRSFETCESKLARIRKTYLPMLDKCIRKTETEASMKKLRDILHRKRLSTSYLNNVESLLKVIEKKIKKASKAKNDQEKRKKSVGCKVNDCDPDKNKPCTQEVSSSFLSGGNDKNKSNSKNSLEDKPDTASQDKVKFDSNDTKPKFIMLNTKTRTQKWSLIEVDQSLPLSEPPNRPMSTSTPEFIQYPNPKLYIKHLMGSEKTNVNSNHTGCQSQSQNSWQSQADFRDIKNPSYLSNESDYFSTSLLSHHSSQFNISAKEPHKNVNLAKVMDDSSAQKQTNEQNMSSFSLKDPRKLSPFYQNNNNSQFSSSFGTNNTVKNNKCTQDYNTNINTQIVSFSNDLRKTSSYCRNSCQYHNSVEENTAPCNENSLRYPELLLKKDNNRNDYHFSYEIKKIDSSSSETSHLCSDSVIEKHVETISVQNINENICTPIKNTQIISKANSTSSYNQSNIKTHLLPSQSLKGNNLTKHYTEVNQFISKKLKLTKFFDLEPNTVINNDGRKSEIKEVVHSESQINSTSSKMSKLLNVCDSVAESKIKAKRDIKHTDVKIKEGVEVDNQATTLFFKNLKVTNTCDRAVESKIQATKCDGNSYNKVEEVVGNDNTKTTVSFKKLKINNTSNTTVESISQVERDVKNTHVKVKEVIIADNQAIAAPFKIPKITKTCGDSKMSLKSDVGHSYAKVNNVFGNNNQTTSCFRSPKITNTCGTIVKSKISPKMNVKNSFSKVIEVDEDGIKTTASLKSPKIINTYGTSVECKIPTKRDVRNTDVKPKPVVKDRDKTKVTASLQKSIPENFYNSKNKLEIQKKIDISNFEFKKRAVLEDKNQTKTATSIYKSKLTSTCDLITKSEIRGQQSVSGSLVQAVVEDEHHASVATVLQKKNLFRVCESLTKPKIQENKAIKSSYVQAKGVVEDKTKANISLRQSKHNTVCDLINKSQIQAQKGVSNSKAKGNLVVKDKNEATAATSLGKRKHTHDSDSLTKSKNQENKVIKNGFVQVEKCVTDKNQSKTYISSSESTLTNVSDSTTKSEIQYKNSVSNSETKVKTVVKDNNKLTATIHKEYTPRNKRICQPKAELERSESCSSTQHTSGNRKTCSQDGSLNTNKTVNSDCVQNVEVNTTEKSADAKIAFNDNPSNVATDNSWKKLSELFNNPVTSEAIKSFFQCVSTLSGNPNEIIKCTNLVPGLQSFGDISSTTTSSNNRISECVARENEIKQNNFEQENSSSQESNSIVTSSVQDSSLKSKKEEGTLIATSCIKNTSSEVNNRRDVKCLEKQCPFKPNTHLIETRTKNRTLSKKEKQFSDSQSEISESDDTMYDLIKRRKLNRKEENSKYASNQNSRCMKTTKTNSLKSKLYNNSESNSKSLATKTCVESICGSDPKSRNNFKESPDSKFSANCNLLCERTNNDDFETRKSITEEPNVKVAASGVTSNQELKCNLRSKVYQKETLNSNILVNDTLGVDQSASGLVAVKIDTSCANLSDNSSGIIVENIFSIKEQNQTVEEDEWLLFANDWLSNCNLSNENDTTVSSTTDSTVSEDIALTDAFEEDLEITYDVFNHDTAYKDIHQNWKSSEAYRFMTTKDALTHFYKCMDRDCMFTTVRESSFAQHLQDHVESYKYGGQIQSNDWKLCCYCCEQIGEVEAYLEHLNTKHSDCVVQCFYCFNRSKTVQDAKLHLRVCHPEDRPHALYLHKNGRIIDLQKDLQRKTSSEM